MQANRRLWIGLVVPALLGGCLLPQPDTPIIGPKIEQGRTTGTGPASPVQAPEKAQTDAAIHGGAAPAGPIPVPPATTPVASPTPAPTPATTGILKGRVLGSGATAIAAVSMNPNAVVARQPL